jgi:site-specific recombinase XerC
MLLLLATSANLRFGELPGLRRNQIGLDACEVRVNTSTSEMNDGPLIDGRSGEVNWVRSRLPRLAPPSERRSSSSNRAFQPFATRPFA